MAEVIPAILEKDFGEIEKKILLINNVTKWVQIDFADNTLVPNTTFPDAGPFEKYNSKYNFELHMMVKDPLKYLEKFAQVGFKRFIAHVEGDNTEKFIEKSLRLNIEVGLAIDGPTNTEKIKKYLPDIDVVLVMAIDAGFSGRPFRSDTADKIRNIRNMEFDLPVAVDGAMDDINAKKVIEAGATRINSNSFIFKSGTAEGVKEAILKLQSL